MINATFTATRLHSHRRRRRHFYLCFLMDENKCSTRGVIKTQIISYKIKYEIKKKTFENLFFIQLRSK